MLQINDDDGYIQVQLGAGEPTKLDLFVASDTFNAKLDGWKEGEIADYYARLKAAANDLGLGNLSGRSAQQVVEGVRQRMVELRKKPVSPEPTL